MLRVGCNEICVSYGDTLNITFNIKGYDVMEGDIAVFTVKRSMRDHQILLQDETECTTDGVAMVEVAAEAMAELPPGAYVYDVFLRRGDDIITITPPSRLVVEEVVHCEFQPDNCCEP